MAAHRKLFGAYDIRGAYGDALCEDFAERLGRAFGKFIAQDGVARVLVGRDGRDSSVTLNESLVKGLLQSGCDVVEMGLGSTPMIAWYGATKEFDGTIAVTASHLAGRYNGFKVYRERAIPIGAGNGLKEIAALVDELPSENGNGRYARGRRSCESALSLYVRHMQRYLDVPRKLKVAVDAVHGAGGPEIELLNAISSDIEFKLIATQVKGDFGGRSPNPLDENALDELCNTVRKEKCDFGMAFDGDADRAIFVDENGVCVKTDVILGLVGGAVVERNGGGTVAYDLRSSRAVPEHIERQGGTAIRTGVGNTFIKTTMEENRAVFAGELSGHYYYADMFDIDNALRTLIEVANLVSNSGKTLGELIQPLSIYSTSGEINFRVSEEVGDVLRRLESSVNGGEKVYIDGLSVSFPNWWFAARGSQTEPVLRLTVGAVDPFILEEQTRQLIGVINQSN